MEEMKKLATEFDGADFLPLKKRILLFIKMAKIDLFKFDALYSIGKVVFDLNKDEKIVNLAEKRLKRIGISVERFETCYKKWDSTRRFCVLLIW
jgi:hypothetical protein